MTSTSAQPDQTDVPGDTDDALFAALETAHGERLKDTIRHFVAGCDAACDNLQEAAACAHWQEAVRLTLQIGGAAHELGLEPIARAARAFADAAYQNTTPHRLRNSAQTVVFEYERFRLALMARYPDFVAPGAYSIA